MKLRNRKTGEVKEWDFGNWYQAILNPENKEKYECSLKEYIDRVVKFNDEWEDVPEEPKVGYIIDPMEEDCMSADNSGYEESDIERAKELGIWFESEEEAEKAVEKLLAFKRLKDKGFSFCGYDDGYKHDFNSGHIEFYVKNSGDVLADLGTCFGGEE